jgi:hypothetical protein
MSNLLQAGQAWLADQLKTHAASTVIYQRGNQQVTVAATIGRTLLKLEDAYGGVHLQWTDRDYLIQAADLVIASVQVLPERGDVIREPTADGKTYLYEVMAPGSEPHWRWSDVYRKLLRIHTKQIGVE